MPENFIQSCQILMRLEPFACFPMQLGRDIKTADFCSEVLFQNKHITCTEFSTNCYVGGMKSGSYSEDVGEN